MNQSNNNNQNSGGGNRQQGGNRPHHNNQGGHGGQRRGFQGRGRPQGQHNNQHAQGNPNQGQQNGQQGQGNQQQAGGGQGQGQGRHQQGGQHPNQRRHHHGRNHHNRPRHPNQNNQGQGPRQHGGERDVVFERYEQLRTEHMAARKKYFEMFGTPDNNLKRKLENTFNKTIEALANYEKTLQPVQREALLKKIELYDFDLTYSNNRELIKPDETIKPSFGLYPGLSDTPPEAPFADPHYLQTQINRASFKEDTEESVGSIEDYKKLKGL